MVAQSRLHVITTIDPHPGDEIAAGCRRDQANVDALFDHVAQELAYWEHPMEVVRHRVGFTREAVARLLSELEAGPEDAIFFLYSGHGLRGGADERWPTLFYCPEPPRTEAMQDCGLPLYEVHRLLKASGARASVAVGNSCNSDPDRPAAPTAPPPPVALTGEDDGEAHYGISVFTDAQTHVIATSARPGEESFLNDAIGSYYVDALVNTIAYAVDTDKSVTWASILRRTDEVVRQRWKKEQHAHFMISAGERETYSDPEAMGGDDLEEIDEAYYSTDWEEAALQAEAMDVLPYLLISYAEMAGGEVEDALALAHDFYAYVLDAYHPDGDPERWAEAQADYYEDPEWFGDEADYANDLYDLLDPELHADIEHFLETLED